MFWNEEGRRRSSGFEGLKKRTRTVWSEEEDKKISRILRRYVDKPIPWSMLAKKFDKTVDQVKVCLVCLFLLCVESCEGIEKEDE